jgi:hypothetical protein
MKPITRQYYAEKVDAWIGRKEVSLLAKCKTKK